MKEKNHRPYTVIEVKTFRNGRKLDICYLVYKNNKLRLSPTEYAVATSMLSPDGLDLADVDDERKPIALWYEKALGDFSNSSSKACQISRLRKKAKSLSEEIVIPVVRGLSFSGLRIWTIEEISKIQQKMQNPGEGIQCVQDERQKLHLYFNGREIRPCKNDITRVQWLVVSHAITKRGLNFFGEEFREAHYRLTGREDLSSKQIGVILADLRRAFEEAEAGINLTHRKIKGDISEHIVRLVISDRLPVRQKTKQFKHEYKECQPSTSA